MAASHEELVKAIEDAYAEIGTKDTPEATRFAVAFAAAMAKWMEKQPAPQQPPAQEPVEPRAVVLVTIEPQTDAQRQELDELQVRTWGLLRQIDMDAQAAATPAKS